MESIDQVIILSDPHQYVFENKWYYELAQSSHFWINGRLQAFLKQINRLNIDTKQNLIGLEIGCGNSVVRRELEKHTSWIVDGTDLDLYGLKIGEKGKGQLYLYDILEQNPNFHQKYDFLILFDVIEHVKDVPTFLKACLFHLKKEGYLFINVPALPGLFSAYDKVQGHYRRYDQAQLQKELNSVSVETLDMRFWGACQVPLVFYRKMNTNTLKDPEVVIRRGFEVNPAVNRILSKILSVENKLFPRPWWGTSLMAIARSQ